MTWASRGTYAIGGAGLEVVQMYLQRGTYGVLTPDENNESQGTSQSFHSHFYDNNFTYLRDTHFETVLNVEQKKMRTFTH